MFYRTLSVIGLATVLAAGCRNSTTNTAQDMTMGGDMATGGDMAKHYVSSDIKTMRAGASGDFSLANVVAIAVSPMATTSPRLIVQDASGGDFSAILSRCSPTSTMHPCTVATTVKTVMVNDSVTLQGTYTKSNTSGFETFYIDMVTVNSHGATPPAIATVALTDVQRNAQTKAKWFQHVTVSNPGTLAMYDFTPAEFMRGNNPTSCPYQFGFGLLPSGGAAATACSGTTSQPPGVTSPSAMEVLIGTDFYDKYNVSTDCRCAAMFNDKIPAMNSTATALGGILIFDTTFTMPPVGYQYLAPLSTTETNVTPVN